MLPNAGPPSPSNIDAKVIGVLGFGAFPLCSFDGARYHGIFWGRDQCTDDLLRSVKISDQVSKRSKDLAKRPHKNPTLSNIVKRVDNGASRKRIDLPSARKKRTKRTPSVTIVALSFLGSLFLSQDLRFDATRSELLPAKNRTSGPRKQRQRQMLLPRRG